MAVLFAMSGIIFSIQRDASTRSHFIRESEDLEMIAAKHIKIIVQSSTDECIPCGTSRQELVKKLNHQEKMLQKIWSESFDPKIKDKELQQKYQDALQNLEKSIPTTYSPSTMLVFWENISKVSMLNTQIIKLL